MLNWSKQLKPNVSFFHRHNVKFPKFSCLFERYLNQLKTLTQVKLDNRMLALITQSLIENTDCLPMCVKFFKSIHIFAILLYE